MIQSLDRMRWISHKQMWRFASNTRHGPPDQGFLRGPCWPWCPLPTILLRLARQPSISNGVLVFALLNRQWW